MTLADALLRATYLRTLHAYVGPRLGWCVRNANNDCAPRPSLRVERKGGEAHPTSSPAYSAGDA